ncbi:MAG: 50S ribosomal protein P1 [Candidatus Micrarchaeota archaeon]|nr:50S ribosomal protein P1 [Candidatus Micrarchaeota archaeon]
MEYIYAALLLDAEGKEVTEDSIKNVVKATGATPDDAMAKSVANALKGVNIKDVIKNAQTMQAAAPAAAAPAQAGKAEEKKSEAEEKKSEEEAASGLASLFG